jgi:predicted DNA binding CopG/RHH family protein
MKPKIKYRDEDLGEIEVIEDFLPSPEQLVVRDESVKVTISLSKSSVDFFKEQASEHNTPYQKMIRRLLDSYVQKYTRPLTTQSSGRRGKRGGATR